VAFDAKAKVVSPNGEFEGKVSNLSLHGILIHTIHKASVGDRLSLVLNLAGGTSDLTIKASGTVVRTVSEGIVVELDDMDLDSFIHIRNIVAYNSGNADLIDKEFQDYVAQRADKPQ
jgi:hypothetical protein